MPDETRHRWRLGRHAPAGQPIPLRAVLGADMLQPLWPGIAARYFDSATAALSVAIGEALARLPVASEKRVVLPAYGCPNLLAATLFAGGDPEFIDFAPGCMAPEPQRLLERLRAGDCVVISVDAFGAPSLSEGFIESLALHERERLILDLAQSFEPFAQNWRPSVVSVVSFGRAKPVSLTTAGLLLSAAASLSESDGEPEMLCGMKLALRSCAYNLSLHPAVFGLISQISFLGIGATRFQPMTRVRRLSKGFERRVASAVAEFQRAEANLAAHTRRIVYMAIDAGAQVPVAAQSMVEQGRPLWRVPVVHSSEYSAAALARGAIKLGVSRLYGRTMSEFSGTSSTEAKRRWPEAWRLSRTLTTLPAHGRLDEHDQRELGSLLRASQSDRLEG